MPSPFRQLIAELRPRSYTCSVTATRPPAAAAGSPLPSCIARRPPPAATAARPVRHRAPRGSPTQPPHDRRALPEACRRRRGRGPAGRAGPAWPAAVAAGVPRSRAPSRVRSEHQPPPRAQPAATACPTGTTISLVTGRSAGGGGRVFLTTVAAKHRGVAASQPASQPAQPSQPGRVVAVTVGGGFATPVEPSAGGARATATASTSVPCGAHQPSSVSTCSRPARGAQGKPAPVCPQGLESKTNDVSASKWTLVQ